jgi:hypothetical protein
MKIAKKEIEFYKKQLITNVILGFISIFLAFIIPSWFKIIFILLFIVCVVKGQILRYKLDKIKAGIK